MLLFEQEHFLVEVFLPSVQFMIPLTDDMRPNKLMIRKDLYAIIDITYFSQFLQLMLIIL